MSAGFIVCRSRREEIGPDRLLAIYRAEPTGRLIALRRALCWEREHATTTDVIAWCDHRLPLIERVLTERGIK